MSFLRNLFGKDREEQGPPPSPETLAEAKKIFFQYSCNGLYMAQNDVNFRQYGISREQEAAWRDEFIAYWRSRLSTEDLTAVRKLMDTDAVEAIPDLLAMLDQGDSYARLRVAEALAAIGYMSRDRTLRERARAAARNAARSLLKQPVRVSESHRVEIEGLGSSDPEDYIVTFAKNIK